MGETDASDIELGSMLGSIAMLGIDGFRKESITIQITRKKSITLRGAKKVLVSSLVLLTGVILLVGFIGVMLIMASG